MKKLPLTQQPRTEVDEAIGVVVEVLGDVEVLAPKFAAGHTSDFEEKQRRMFREVAELAAVGTKLLMYRRRDEARGVPRSTRRSHVFLCYGCGCPLLVSSGPKGHQGKSTLRGGCAQCKKPTKGIRQGVTLEHAHWVMELTYELPVEEPEQEEPEQGSHTNGQSE